VVGSIKL